MPYKFVKAILKEYEYCRKIMKKHFNKNLIMMKKNNSNRRTLAGFVKNSLMMTMKN